MPFFDTWGRLGLAHVLYRLLAEKGSSAPMVFCPIPPDLSVDCPGCLVADVRLVLLDDCLAAVDPHVARAICEEALLGPGGGGGGGGGEGEGAHSGLSQRGHLFGGGWELCFVCSLGGILLQEGRSVVMVMNSNFVALRAASRIVNMEHGRASMYTSVQAWIADCSQATKESCLQTLADIKARPPSDAGDNCSAEEGDVLECAEQSRTGVLSTKTLTYYFGSGRHAAGVVFLYFILMSMVAVEGLRIYSDYFMGVWAARDLANTAAESSEDFQTFCLWVLLAVFGAFLRGWLVIHVALKSSENIHHRLLERLMSAPIGLFDTTPRGRILGHFSKDLDAVDALLPQYLLDFLQARAPLGRSLLLLQVLTCAQSHGVGFCWFCMQKPHSRGTLIFTNPHMASSFNANTIAAKGTIVYTKPLDHTLYTLAYSVQCSPGHDDAPGYCGRMRVVDAACRSGGCPSLALGSTKPRATLFVGLLVVARI